MDINISLIMECNAPLSVFIWRQGVISNDIIIIIVTLFYCNCINNLYLYLETINMIFKKKKRMLYVIHVPIFSQGG